MYFTSGISASIIQIKVFWSPITWVKPHQIVAFIFEIECYRKEQFFEPFWFFMKSKVFFSTCSLINPDSVDLRSATSLISSWYFLEKDNFCTFFVPDRVTKTLKLKNHFSKLSKTPTSVVGYYSHPGLSKVIKLC